MFIYLIIYILKVFNDNLTVSSGNSAVLVHLDLQAFDPVDQNILLSHLEQLVGIKHKEKNNFYDILGPLASSANVLSGFWVFSLMVTLN